MRFAKTRFLIASFLFFASSSLCQAQMNVFLDFDAQWQANLDSLTSSAGVNAFSAGERLAIESNIFNELNSVYSEFNLNFSTADPGGSRTRIDFGATSSSSGVLGSAPLDYFNASVNQNANMFAANFGFILDEFSGSDQRSTQIDQVSLALAGTAAHELGHSIGMHHHHAYGTPAINPSNYAATGGVQNNHVIATGSTGLGETGRQTSRTLSQWSRLMLEATGGLDSSLHGVTGTALADTILFEADHVSGGDVGNTAVTADLLQTTSLPISGYEKAAHAFSSLSGETDVDMFAISVDEPAFITAEVVHNSRWGSSLDPFLEIIDIDGLTVIESNDNGNYSGNTYGSGGFGVEDSFLINVELATAGTYYLRVSSSSGGGNYSLLVGADEISAIPEPTSLLILGASGALVCLVRRRRMV